MNSKQQNLNKETSNYIQNIEEKNTVNKTGYVLRKKKKRYGFSNSEGINCHMCGEIKPINKVITCCIPNCRESFCTKCLKKHYVNFYIFIYFFLFFRQWVLWLCY